MVYAGFRAKSVSVEPDARCKICIMPEKSSILAKKKGLAKNSYFINVAMEQGWRGSLSEFMKTEKRMFPKSEKLKIAIKFSSLLTLLLI